MRLVCPNCGAQYEIDADLIPPEGRDVQCSACGHAWFEAPADAGAAPAAPPSDPAAAGSATAAHADEPAPRQIAPDVLDVLRQEAARETRARRGAGAPSAPTATHASEPEPGPEAASDSDSGPESASGPELGPELEPEPEPEPDRGSAPTLSPARPQAPSQRSARARPAASTPPDAQPAGVDAPNDRSALLPDIDSISSTLDPEPRSRKQADRDGAAEPVPERGGFLRGFLLMLGVMLLALALYIGAEPLAEAVPGLAPALDAYVAVIDRAHLWLAEQVDAALAWVQAQIG